MGECEDLEQGVAPEEEQSLSDEETDEGKGKEKEKTPVEQMASLKV